MTTSESYVELINRVYSRSRQEGSRSYPVASYEVFLLSQAQERAKRKEADLFRKLGDIFDWQMSRRQRNGYLKSMRLGFTLVLTDPAKTILWTSNNFLSMTGYIPGEVLGQTPSILQGPDTDARTLRRVRESLQREESVKADLLNYRKDGESYICRVAIDPLYNGEGELTHFLAVECEVKAE
ncbi:Blue-light-activated protein Includes: RecName: Full=Blue-light-activated histidine kinase [Fibrisoma limi BUZ 3]|uniref:WGS project CAIT00000000 data, contig 9 n=1 Tax=Fibrisoma limi BUZ 3 TaxID=1185876 RepID=I2GNU2_9BACT|nr:PAS domain-containing protein [Fibrisoma limi]CCH55570.1 Blue-light-activated protein Includes: RecName: Full=Blue-light-activated histidine kinase [Fibrisoma limi BUZ 3]